MCFNVVFTKVSNVFLNASYVCFCEGTLFFSKMSISSPWPIL